MSLLKVFIAALLLTSRQERHERLNKQSTLVKRGEGEHNTQEKPLPDLNSSPPVSPVENVEEGTRTPSLLEDQSKSKSRGGLNKKYEGQRKLARSYSKEGIKKAKATLQGEELNNFLIRANRFRIERNKFEKRYRKEMANRFLTGTQTIQDETRREKARQRARKSNEKRKRMSKKE